jgi:DNA-binding winged helix-turn-helix (wHTH) protein
MEQMKAPVEAAIGVQRREHIERELPDFVLLDTIVTSPPPISNRRRDLISSITAMEYDLLATFLANPNRVLSRDQLLLRTRNRECESFDRSIDIRIGRLRRKIEPDPSGEPRCIRTVRSAGYMFIPNTS